MSVSDTLVLVEMGELIQGTIDKRTVGNGQMNKNTHNNSTAESAAVDNAVSRAECAVAVCASFACLFLIFSMFCLSFVSHLFVQPKTL